MQTLLIPDSLITDLSPLHALPLGQNLRLVAYAFLSEIPRRRDESIRLEKQVRELTQIKVSDTCIPLPKKRGN